MGERETSNLLLTLMLIKMSDLMNEVLPTFSQGSCENCGSFEGFSDALTIWINKPHVVNRRLCGSGLKYHKTYKKESFDRLCKDQILTDLGFHLDKESSFHSVYFEGMKCNDHSGKECTGSSTLGESNVPCDNNPHMVMKIFQRSDKIKDTDNPTDPLLQSEGFQNAADIFQSEFIHESDTIFELPSLSCTGGGNVCVIIRELLPKQPERHRNMPEIVIFDHDRQSCTFYPLNPVSMILKNYEVIYEFRYITDSDTNRIQLFVNDTDQTRDSERKLSLTWLQEVLLKKLARWSETPNLKTSLTSLKLVPVDEYSKLYSELKNKYGLHFAKIWPENTDPQKFVFEDVSIATYLLLLWKQDREKKGLTKNQSFVDLGCGNGLLVHILASEGHPGYGLDIRRRKIWDLYGPKTILKECTVTPSSDCLFPDSDWLIGNHSDELTPWIPVMAARSAFTCSYFVLPCCHFDFNTKFSYDPEFGRVSDGQYQCYLNFVRYVGQECGFEVEEDVLRIPSTKRVCFIGRTRSYDQSCEQEMDQSRQAFIERRCGLFIDCDTACNNATVINNDAKVKWIENFKPRDKVETVRNCVKISQEVKDRVISTVFGAILESADCETRTGHDGKTWRKGGHIPISEVCDLFDKLTLGELKNECGGLQTLLRNNSQLFQVSSGIVQLRDFTEKDPFEGRSKKKGKPSSNKGDYFKTSLCWFYLNHPDGCPRSAEMCMYAHGKDELKQRPAKHKQKY